MQQQQISGAVPLHPGVVLTLGQCCSMLLGRVLLGRRTGMVVFGGIHGLQKSLVQVT